jgi:hypothetical protein
VALVPVRRVRGSVFEKFSNLKANLTIANSEKKRGCKQFSKQTTNTKTNKSQIKVETQCSVEEEVVFGLTAHGGLKDRHCLTGNLVHHCIAHTESSLNMHQNQKE